MIAIVQKTTVWYLSMAVSKQSASKESVDDLVSRVLNMEDSRGCSRVQTAIVTAPRMQTPAPHVLGEARSSLR
jgi:hypothetical protein